MKILITTNKRHGQSLVEFAITLSILIVILAGAIDFGVGFFSYVAIRDAAQEGALYGSIIYDEDHPGYTVSDFQNMIITRVRDSSNAPVDLYSPNVTVQVIPPMTWCAGYPLIVDVIYVYPLTMPLIGIITDPSITLHASATSTILRPLCP